MSFYVTILGSNSAVPTAKRFPTSQVLHVNQSLYLIDCGEGTQMQLRRNSIKFQRIKAIFISHLHGDHIFGLPGVLTTMNLLGRKAELHIIAHADLFEFIKLSLKISKSWLDFEIKFIPLNHADNEVVYKDEHLQVRTTSLKHRIACNGFLFEQAASKPKVNKWHVENEEIPLEWIKHIKQGKEEIEWEGSKIDLKPFILPPLPVKKYAFITDTLPLEKVKDFAKEVDLLYHEATFLGLMKKRAKETFHSTAAEAAQLAKDASAKKLLIGHFSARYNDLSMLLEEAKSIFPNTILAEENSSIEV